MAPVIVDPDKVLPFETGEAFYLWLKDNHAAEDFLWVKFYKVHTGYPTLSYEDAVRAALCWGWIDGIKKKFDTDAYVLRFTPRRKASIWSQINVRHAENLIAEGLMQAPGLREIEAAKADGRWERAYAPGASFEVPQDFLDALAADARAKAMFETLNRANLYALTFRINNAKRTETRQRKIEEFIAMLARGETLHPNGKQK
ncbi:YdeI family protein [Pelagibacterium halotolerans]|uniref:YdeI/OmpD-associated family protein n=1 Tax=Pelagibacterium halotolerans TaxID=531813 RepID=UPI00384EB9EC